MKILINSPHLSISPSALTDNETALRINGLASFQHSWVIAASFALGSWQTCSMTEKRGASLRALDMGISRAAVLTALNKWLCVYSRCYSQAMQTLTYEYKLEPTSEQSQAFEQWLEICRQVYNYALRERQDWVNSRKCQVNACSLKPEYIWPADAPRPTFYTQCKSLAAAKETSPDLKVPHTHVLQQVLRTLESAFVAMWERGHGFPRFKKRMRSFVYPQLNKVPVKKVNANGTSQTCPNC